jgi:hypothetical protein
MLKCSFCGSVAQASKAAPTQAAALETDSPSGGAIPLALTEKELELAAYEYMASGDLTPDDLIEAAIITKIERSYVPAFLFSVEFSGRWQASFGYDRREPYTNYRTVRKGSGESAYEVREPYTAYRTVTDWRPSSGSFEGHCVAVGYAGSRLPASIATLVEDGAAARYANADAVATAGYFVEETQKIESEVLETRKSTINTAIEAEVVSKAQGDRQRDWTWESTTQVSTKRFLYPICRVEFQYQEKLYTLFVDGADITKRVGDPLPVDEVRKKDIAESYIPFAASLVASFVAFSYSLNWENRSTLLSLLFFVNALLLAFSATRHRAVLNYSKSIRTQILEFYKASRAAANSVSQEVAGIGDVSSPKPKRPFIAQKNAMMTWLPSILGVGLVALVYFSQSGSVPLAKTMYAGGTSPSVDSNFYQIQEQLKTLSGTSPSVDSDFYQIQEQLKTLSGTSPSVDIPKASPNTTVANPQNRSGGRFPNMNDTDICRTAVNVPKEQWEGTGFASYIDEAVDRGYSAASCVQLLKRGTTASSSVGGPSTSVSISNAPVRGGSSDNSSSQTRDNSRGAVQAVPVENVKPSFDCQMPSVQQQPLAQAICRYARLSLEDRKLVIVYQALRQQYLNQPHTRNDLANAADQFSTKTVPSACGLPDKGTLPDLTEAQVDCISLRYSEFTASLAGRATNLAREEFSSLGVSDFYQIQEQLKRLRLLPSDADVDGVFGPMTRAAISEWEKIHQSPGNGFASQSMLQAMRGDPPFAPEGCVGTATQVMCGKSAPAGTSSVPTQTDTQRQMERNSRRLDCYNMCIRNPVPNPNGRGQIVPSPTDCRSYCENAIPR